MGGRGGDGGACVGVVTDSTACLTPELVEPFGGLLRVVPLSVTLGEATYVEGEDITSEDVAQAQADGVQVTTSRPSPARFVDAYTALAEAGCSVIVSLHASGALSSTVSSARLAAVESPVPVDVVDSGTIGMALGFGALSAAQWAHAGRRGSEVAAAARHVFDMSSTAFYVDSLEPLRRGGRIGRAGALVGSALAIKPLLHVHEGAIAPLARVRSSQKAMARLAQWAQARGADLPPSGRACAVHSADRSERGQLLRTELAGAPGTDAAADGSNGAAPQGDWTVGPLAAPLGAVVTAHVGPGAVAVVVTAMLDPRGPDSPVAGSSSVDG